MELRKAKDIYIKHAEKFDDNDGKYLPLILECMLTEEESAMCCEMPDTIENLAKKTGKTVEETLAIVKECTRKGAVHYGPDSSMAYNVKYIVTLTDYGAATPHYDKERGEFYDLLKALRLDPDYLQEFGQQILEDGAGEPCFRVVPRWDAIKHIPGVMPCESMPDILREHDGKISTVRCICRTVIHDRFCGVFEGTLPEEGHCVKFGEVAEHYVENMGVGSYVSADTIMKRFEHDKNQNFYHMLCNTREIKGGFCNCCDCCCDMRYGGKALGDVKKALSPSRFMASCDANCCIGCGTCAAKCPFDAVKLVDGCCTIDKDKCMGCGVCVVNCPAEVLQLDLVRGPEHIPTGGPQHIYESLKSLELDKKKEL